MTKSDNTLKDTQAVLDIAISYRPHIVGIVQALSEVARKDQYHRERRIRQAMEFAKMTLSARSNQRSFLFLVILWLQKMTNPANAQRSFWRCDDQERS